MNQLGGSYRREGERLLMGRARTVRNSGIWGNMLKETIGAVKSEWFSPTREELQTGSSRLSTEPWGLQHFEVGGEGTRCRAE